DNVMEDDLIEKEGEKDEFVDHSTDAPKDAIDDELMEGEEENEKISSGNDLNSDDFCEDCEPAVKKSRMDSQEETKKKYDCSVIFDHPPDIVSILPWLRQDPSCTNLSRGLLN
ncbi:hypothetical protein PENTCL1PPCAC_8221, partial [Pristionchus entomophagus]